MRLAILGCGYVANMYRLTLAAHPGLELAGVFDLERSRSENMGRLTGARIYPDFEALLGDESVPLVLNLTNPHAHHATTRALLEAGKHVWTEKPLAMVFEEAQALVALAEARGLALASAPSTLLNRVAQTVWQRLRNHDIGALRLVYAEMEDGMVARAPTAKWINEAGVGWPTVDEFEVGCTVEHAGYVLNWLCAFLGPAETVTAHAAMLQPEKIPGVALHPAADFSVACIRFRSGVIARMTNGIYAPHDHRLRFFGDDGVLTVEDPRSDRSAVTRQRYHTVRRRRFLGPARRLRLLGGRERIAAYRGSQTRDFCRAIAEMADAIDAGRAPYLNAHFALHITELTLACQAGARGTLPNADPGGGHYRMTTDFAPMEPLAWAR
jgi:predicted dehydrogenase